MYLRQSYTSGVLPHSLYINIYNQLRAKLAHFNLKNMAYSLIGERAK